MKPKKKSTRKPMPKVWGRSPKFSGYGFVRRFFGSSTLRRGNDVLTLATDDCYPTKAAALRAVRKLWRETFSCNRKDKPGQ